VKESGGDDVEPDMSLAPLQLEDAQAPFELAPVTTTRPDPDSFIAMLKQYDRSLRSLVFRLMGDRDAMDDVLQDVYLRAYRALPSFRGDAAAGTWLYRIAYNVCIDELRRRQRRPAIRLDEVAEEADPGIDPSELAALRGDVAEALERLPVEQRAAVILVDAHGFDYVRAGEILGVPAGTVGSRVSRARATLRLALGGQS
jgi:RNA polymerase sigma-70 factor (ECF subfamily)